MGVKEYSMGTRPVSQENTRRAHQGRLFDGLPGDRSSRKQIAFGRYTGKDSRLDWLLPLLPECHHYCEPFGGSVAVLLNRTLSPVETYNDLDGEVVNFFRMLRDHKDELLYQIGKTPPSREELLKAIKTNGKESSHLSDLERARRFFVRAQQVRTGLAQTASAEERANCLSTSRPGMARAVSRWLGSVEGLESLAARLLRVQIEHDTAANVIKRYDSPETLFYCDPPYPHESRGDAKAYSFEMTDQEHVQLSRVLHLTKGKVAVSGYQCDLMCELYADWQIHLDKPKKAMSIKKERQEALWTNY
jgi:DNA adenine methylase